ncbi:hypothetical protein M0805_006728 [Coniferiporia weirii]|nr:hypothetical protein M0805_006728 [Coniferiporia weirii]
MSSSSEDKNLEKPSSARSNYKFPKNFKDLVFVNPTDEDALSKGKGDKKQLRSWRGLSFLRSSLGVDEITSLISSWSWPITLVSIQEKSDALLLELSRGAGSLFSQIVNDPPDQNIYPECQWDASVRLGDTLCMSERAFLRERRRKMKTAFARLFDVDESEVDERDLPVVAIAGSGGGFRAMTNTVGSLIGAKKSGVLDCITYMAGISGSCWALGVLYSGVAGTTAPEAVAEHINERIRISYVDVSVLDMLIRHPTNRYLLSGILRKANSAVGKVSLVDLYGTLVSARLFVPKDIERLDPRFLSLHQFRRNLDDGSLPLPIFTAILHETPVIPDPRPLAKVQGKHRSADESGARDKGRLALKKEGVDGSASRLWFEFTPFEVGCDRLGAWIPTWSLGRRFEGGKSIERIPEISFTILTGIYSSAFCASLQHYFNEVQPVLRQLPAQLYGWLNDVITENHKEIGVMHPVEPDELPNFVKGMTGQLRMNTHPDITERGTIGLMDAGAELNIPYYPLLRRNVDCIIALDASADSQDLWFTRAEQYAARLGISSWPKGARWPALIQSADEKSSVGGAIGPSPQEPKTPSEAANRALAEAQEREASVQAQGVSEKDRGKHADAEVTRAALSDDELRAFTGSPTEHGKQLPPSRVMSASTIWMGSSTGLQESSRLDDLEERDLMARDGIAIVYNPLIPNDAVPGFDPMSVSTWSFSMEKEDSEKLSKVAEANFMEGQEKIVKLLRAIWLRKKAEREKAETGRVQ